MAQIWAISDFFSGVSTGPWCVCVIPDYLSYSSMGPNSMFNPNTRMPKNPKQIHNTKSNIMSTIE